MDFESNTKQFKEFLLLYNQISESCFNLCVKNLHHRNVSIDETSCADQCVQKHINVNHKMMSVYAELQPVYMQRRMDDLMKQSQLENQLDQPDADTQLVQPMENKPE